MKKIISLIVLLACIGIYAQDYKLIKLKLMNPERDLQVLSQYDIDIEHAIISKENELIAFVSEESFVPVSMLNFGIEVLIDDWSDYFNSLPKMSESEIQSTLEESKIRYGVEGFGYGSMGGYYTFNEVIAQLDSMKLRFPNLITAKQVIGTTAENRPIYAVKISDNPDITENEPQVLYTALHHAREPQGMMTVIYYMYYLLENYATNPSVQYLVNNREIFFIPVVNPDGYEYNRTTNPSGGGMWRKNRRNSYGIDLNRNYGPFAYWNAPNGGSSTSTSSDTYRGTAPFSENETKAIQNFLLGKNIKTCLNYHTYSNLLIYPYGALSRETPDSLIFREFANDMVRYNGYSPGTDMQTVGYSTRGNSDDFMYDGDTTGTRGKIFAMTPEVGSSSDYFWPPQSRIFPLAIENLMPNIYYTWVAGAFVALENTIFDRQYFNPGDQVSLTVQMKNKGLSKGENLNFILTSLSPYATVQNGSLNADSISARSSYTLPSPFTFTIAANAPIEQKISLRLQTLSGGVQMASDTISFYIGVPNYIFKDTTNNPVSLWTITASPTSSPKWDATTSSFHSTPNSYTDSKTGNYVSNATVTLTTTNPINLAGFSAPKLTFWTKFSIESSWDCGVVQISNNNGANWVTLQGQYSRPASGDGKQVPEGMPIYDGSLTNWVKEEINLSAYAGQSVKLRFELRTDGSVNQDGWYLDDIGIFVYSSIPVELTSFSATSVETGALLQWQTATETNNKGFYVERSSNGINWNKLSFVNGKGTTTNETDYTFLDKEPLIGISFYRLVQVDFDGTMKIHGPVTFNNNIIHSFDLEQNYPNPFNPVTTINFSLPNDGIASLKVYDVLGNEVDVLLNGFQKAGRQSIQFDASKLSSGIYFYELRSGNEVKRMKMNILK